MLYKVILKKQILHVTEEDNDFPRLMCCAIGSSLQVQHTKKNLYLIYLLLFLYVFIIVET